MRNSLCTFHVIKFATKTPRHEIAEEEEKNKMAGELTLRYWNGRGLMEVPRVMLAIAGKAPGAGYTDVRASGTDGVGNAFDCNLGRMVCSPSSVLV